MSLVARSLITVAAFGVIATAELAAQSDAASHAAAETAAAMIETILAGEDSDAAWVALSSALDDEVAAARPVSLRLTPAEVAGVQLEGDAGRRTVSGAGSGSEAESRSVEATSGGSLSGLFARARGAIESASPETLSRALTAMIGLMIATAVLLLLRALLIARRTTVGRPRRVTRRLRRGRKVVSRDAARLEARLRTRRAA